MNGVDMHRVASSSGTVGASLDGQQLHEVPVPEPVPPVTPPPSTPPADPEDPASPAIPVTEPPSQQPPLRMNG